MIRAALAYARKGLQIFPCQPRAKRPATANGLKDATTDPDRIRAWWHHEPAFNVAVATGSVSGVFVVDVDGLDAEVELRKLEAEHGALQPGRCRHGSATETSSTRCATPSCCRIGSRTSGAENVSSRTRATPCVPHSSIHAAPESPGPRQPATCSIAASRCDLFETSVRIAETGQLTALAPSLALA